MTALNYNLEAQTVTVVQDTLCTAADGGPDRFAMKTDMFPHLYMLAGFMGSPALYDRWRSILFARARPELTWRAVLKVSPEFLRKTWHETADSKTTVQTEIVLFAATGDGVAGVRFSAPDFEPVEIEPGVVLNPRIGSHVAEAPESDFAWALTVERQTKCKGSTIGGSATIVQMNSVGRYTASAHELKPGDALCQ